MLAAGVVSRWGWADVTSLAASPRDLDVRSISAQAEALAAFIERMAAELAVLRAMLPPVVAATEGASSTPSSPPDGRWLTTGQAAALLGVNRKVLDELAEKHSRITGGPIDVSVGRKRRHLRWPADGLGTWFDATQAADAAPAVRRGRPPGTRAQRPPSTMPEGRVDWNKVGRGE